MALETREVQVGDSTHVQVKVAQDERSVTWRDLSSDAIETEPVAQPKGKGKANGVNG